MLSTDPFEGITYRRLYSLCFLLSLRQIFWSSLKKSKTCNFTLSSRIIKYWDIKKNLCRQQAQKEVMDFWVW